MSTLASPTAASRFGVAVALVLLDSKPAHLTVSEYMKAVQRDLKRRSSPSHHGSSTRATNGGSERGVRDGSEAAGEGDAIEGDQTIGARSARKDDLKDVELVVVSDAEAVEAARKVSPSVFQIVSLLAQSSVSSPVVVNELLREVDAVLRPITVAPTPPSSSHAGAVVGDELIISAARVVMWVVGRLDRANSLPDDLSLSALLSSLICATSTSSTLSTAFLLPLVQRTLSVFSTPPLASSLASQTLSSFVALVRCLGASSEGVGPQLTAHMQQQLLALVDLAQVLMECKGAENLKPGLTKVIAELGVPEVFGAEVEGAVLALLKGYEVPAAAV